MFILKGLLTGRIGKGKSSKTPIKVFSYLTPFEENALNELGYKLFP